MGFMDVFLTLSPGTYDFFLVGGAGAGEGSNQMNGSPGAGGGGGGDDYHSFGTSSPGAGGSGIVIIRWRTSN